MNTIQIRVSEAGGVFTTVSLPEGSTVLTALRTAGARTDVAKTININGQPASTDTIVQNGDTVYVVPNVRGN